jgi:YHS domain-containing protein
MGRVYLFSSAENQQRFLTNPDAYAPILRGYDPVRYMDQGTVVDGKRKHGLYYGEKYFLFSDESTLQQFQGNPNRYLSANTVR